MSDLEDGAAGSARARHLGAPSAPAAERNRLLRALATDDYAALLPLLTPVRLRLRQVLIEPDEPITDVYFIREGVASIIATRQEGGNIEVGTVGNEGLVGLTVMLGAETMANRVIVQVEGDAWRIAVTAFRRLVDERPALRNRCLQYVAYFTSQLSQAVACNRLHTLEERCARWLLMTHDRVYADTFEMTHEFLGIMLGVRRAGVTVAMGALQSTGIVEYARGRVTVVDRAQLEHAACDCYGITRSVYQGLFGGALG